MQRINQVDKLAMAKKEDDLAGCEEERADLSLSLSQQSVIYPVNLLSIVLILLGF